MASSSVTSLTIPLHLLHRFGSSSSRVGLRALHRPSPPSVRLRQPARGLLRAIAAVYHDDASAWHGNDDGIAAATSTLLLRQVVDDAAVVELPAARTVGRAPEAPKRRGAPSPNKVDPATKPPEEGIGGDGGKHN
ncbi:unnamed protein product [Urochloa decumbens]|uniref:Uncharacterized protein n=1 Tax=Urochloa decumbens TaxID=240449 RepID=A0ABC9BW93_9POAL